MTLLKSPALVALLLLTAATTDAFAPPSTPFLAHRVGQSVRVPSPLQALPVDQLADLSLHWDAALTSASLVLSADEAVAAAGEATGWWGSYVNLFKSTLYWVHSTIDGPLRSVGIDQTWGISIAIFTFGT